MLVAAAFVLCLWQMLSGSSRRPERRTPARTRIRVDSSQAPPGRDSRTP
jgi:hypothetical protein